MLAAILLRFRTARQPEAGKAWHLNPQRATRLAVFNRLRLKPAALASLEIRGNHIAANRYRARAELIRDTAADTAGPAVRQHFCKLPKNTNGSPRPSRPAR